MVRQPLLLSRSKNKGVRTLSNPSPLGVGIHSCPLPSTWCLFNVCEWLVADGSIGDYAALFLVQAEVGRSIEYGTVEQIFAAPQHDLTAAYVNGIRG
jgi:hypothetical protein